MAAAGNEGVALDEIAGWIRDASSVVALTGAGISTESGIPDFRGPNGVWTKNPAAERLSNIDAYMSDPDVRVQSWQARLAHPAWTAEPNAGHLALADLERAGRLDVLVTQNVDGLHQKAGLAEELVVEVHGTIWWTRCWECQDRRPMSDTLARVDAGEEDPPCEVCGGILKSDTISFGQALIPEVIDRAMQVSEECDLLLAVGSTLAVYPAAYCVPRAKAGGARIVIVNAGPTEMDGLADAVLNGQIGEIVPRLVAAS